MPDLAPFAPLLLLVGTVLGASVAFFGTYLTQRNLWTLDVLKDARALRDAKRERLRNNYTAVLQAYTELFANMPVGPSNDEQAQTAKEKLEQVFLQLLLEPEAEPVITQLSVFMVEKSWLSDLLDPDERIEPVGILVSAGVPAGDLDSRRKYATPQDLRRAMRDSLKAFEQPIRRVK